MKVEPCGVYIKQGIAIKKSQREKSPYPRTTNCGDSSVGRAHPYPSGEGCGRRFESSSPLK